MIRLIQRRLIIPRGDTGTFTVPVISAKNTGDIAVFSIINNLTERKIFEKIVEVSGDTMTIEFSHNDTVNLPVGKYVWDIKFYSNPVFVDGALVDGVEVDSYYAAFTLPICEIRQTGDNLLMADDAPDTELTPSQLNMLNATVNETNAAKRDAAASASAAEASAIAAAGSAGNAADSATNAAATKGQIDVLVAQVAADAAITVNAKNDAVASATSAGTSATSADASATIASNAATTATNKANEAYTNAGLAETAKVNAQSAASAASISAASAQAAANEIKSISAEATTLQPDSSATATYNSSTGKLTFGIPRGNGITSAVMNNDYTLTLTYTNGNTFTTPPLKGEQGDAFHIVKTYNSITAMNADYSGNDVEVGEFVMIASTVEDPDNAKVYVKGDQQYNFVIDMSGARGINGIGISNIQKTSTSGKVDTYTITYTDNTSTTFNVVNGEDGSEYTVLVQSTQPIEDANKLWIPTTSGIVQQVPTVAEMESAIAGIQVPVQDVQINGTSIVQSGMANVPVASTSDLGVVRVNNELGIKIVNNNSYSNVLALAVKDADSYKGGIDAYAPVTPYVQHFSVFYGLATAAGDTTQKNSNNSVGNYTEAAKSAISEMLNGSVSISGSVVTLNARAGVRYVCGEVAILDISTPVSGIIDVIFTSGSTPTVLSIAPPTAMTMKWANEFDPTNLDANTTYEISIMDGVYGVVCTWT